MKMPTERLWSEAERRHIRVFWRQLPSRRGLYYQDDELVQLSTAIIILDPSLQKSESALRTVLAHEIGHDATFSGQSELFTNKRGRHISRNEYRANRWAALYLMGPHRIEAVLCCGCQMDELAELFGVEPWLAQFALQLYRESTR